MDVSGNRSDEAAVAALGYQNAESLGRPAIAWTAV